MTWSDFYLICFAVGFFFSLFSFVFGGSRAKLHLPHFHGHAGGHLPAAHGPVAHGPATVGQGATHGTGSGHVHKAVSVSPFNPPAIAAFLAWFGGAGYLLTRFSVIWIGFALSLSVIAGLIGGGIIFLFLSRVLISEEECLDPADFEMVGVLGKLSMPIRNGGTGELIYSQMGTRRVCGARSDDGTVMTKGMEVVVTRYEKGIAYVRLWSEMSGEPDETRSVVP
ncbi:MAG TPA: hypothetical protein VHW45_07370 [Candidatus Sulfotelmatobacter sp.]|jgi:hypothetical protein|nr:hypothetical protein [Candidatus Sulfotelmatobacter sp.]